MEISTKEVLVTEGLVLNLDSWNRDSYSGTGTTWSDLSGNGNNAELRYAYSYDNKSLLFTDTGYANILDTSDFDFSGDFSLEFWFYLTETPNATFPSPIFASWQSAVTINDKIILFVNSSLQIALQMNTSTNTLIYPSTISLNQWYHIVVSRVSGVVNIYLNGVVGNSLNYSSAISPILDMRIGAYEYQSDPLGQSFVGKIPVARIYKDRGLTSKEVTQHYENQKGRFFGQNNLTIEVKPPVSEAVLYLDAAIETSYPGYGTRWFDLSGYRNNGTLLNGVAYDSGDGGYLSFDGIDDYITVPYSDIFNMTNLTVMSWFYISSFPDFQQYRIIDHQETSERAWGLQMGRGDYVGGGYTSSDIILFCHSNDGISQKNLPCSTKLSLNTWYHGGFSNDGTTLKIYLNGSLTDTTSSLGNQYSSTNNDIVIGCSGETRNEFFWNGRISHCSVYNRALTELEIEKDYIYQRDRFLGLSNFGQSSLIIS